jgi:hypothetical protein
MEQLQICDFHSDHLKAIGVGGAGVDSIQMLGLMDIDRMHACNALN